MKQLRSRKRLISRASGMMMLISALALAGTIGGWAALAAQEAGTAVRAAAPSVSAASNQVEHQATTSLRAPASLRVISAAPRPITRTRSSR